MKGKLNHIAIALFIINNTVFDLISIHDNARLNITFFSIMYLSFLLICVQLHINENKKYTFGSIMGVGFIVRIFWELSKWNLTFDAYMESVNNYENGLLFSFLMITIILKYKTYERNRGIDHDNI